MKMKIVAVLCMFVSAVCVVRSDEFVGPFPSWVDVKAEFGAAGDGVADDTAAIQAALNVIRKGDTKRVLYFPAGTYRITDTLMFNRVAHTEPSGTTITGEHPETTVIKWDGEEGKSMLFYNAWYASISRLTLDGSGKAKTGIEHGEAFSTASETTDMIFKDLQYGIEAGVRDGIAEMAVLRCRFYRCSEIAVSIQNFNSLDWYIWNCHFEDCGIAVSNERGAGNYHVYYSTLVRSKVADFRMKHTSFVSLWGNLSYESKRFFHAMRADNWQDFETWSGQVTIQDNRIQYPQETPVVIFENNGQNLILDNTIYVRGEEDPVIRQIPPSEGGDLIVIGNRWSVGKTIEHRGRLTEFDNKYIKIVPPIMPPWPRPFLSRATRPVIEVAAGADAKAIQEAIDKAAELKGQRPVVHLPKGRYEIAETIVIPAGSDVQLVGDGIENATELRGAESANPIILVKSPSKATFRNFLVTGGKREKSPVAILIENADCGGMIFGDQLNASGFEQGFVIEGLGKTAVELHSAGHNGMSVAGAGEGTQPWVTLFAGSSSRDGQGAQGIAQYTVKNGGRLFVRDLWYEGNGWSMVHLKDFGELAMHSIYMCPADRNHLDRTLEWEKDIRANRAAFEFDNFKGNVTFSLLSTSDGTVRVVPPSPDLKLYLLGFSTGAELDFSDEAIKGKVVSEHQRTPKKDSHPDYPWQHTGTMTLPDIGTPSPEFTKEMLKPLRTLKPQGVAPRGDDENDIRFYRVWAIGFNGVRIQK